MTPGIDPLTEEGLDLAIQSYVRHWGGMVRWLGTKSRLTGPIHAVVKRNLNELQQLSSLDPTAVPLSDVHHLDRIYDDISKVEFQLKGKQKKFGATATGKLLHMLLPNVCVIWDNKTVRQPWSLKDSGNSYVEYVLKKWDEFGSVAKDLLDHNPNLRSSAALEMEIRHSNHLASLGFRDVNEPISKLLDEANYAVD